ncbi:hypothetical protein T492DRAFT_991690 [Pavlovales sp. CCMP2436]|nr:hypothetical protein T492DRAFT_991690 [Pavlovales sp. CCMP2436]
MRRRRSERDEPEDGACPSAAPLLLGVAAAVLLGLHLSRSAEAPLELARRPQGGRREDAGSLSRLAMALRRQPVGAARPSALDGQSAGPPLAWSVFVHKLPDFVASPRVKTVTAAFNARCSSELASLKAHAARYRTLERVLVFEPPASDTQGIGTLAWWYYGAWVLGMRSERAAFFANGYGTAFELNRFFHADAFARNQLINWNWADTAVRGNVSAAMAAHGLSRPDGIIDSICTSRGRVMCAYVATGPTKLGSAPRRKLKRSFDTLAAAIDSLASCRWVVVKLWNEVVGRPVNKWPGNWVRRGGREGMTAFDCLMASLLKPAPIVQQSLLQLLSNLDRAGAGLAGLHIRTLALDIIIKVNKDAQMCTREERDRQAALLGLLELRGDERPEGAADALSNPGGRGVAYSLKGAWELWNRMAADNCGHPDSRCGPPADRLTTLSASRWPLLSVCNGTGRVRHRVPALNAPGTLSSLLACSLARSAASAHACGRQSRIFLATDSVGLLKLLRATPGLSKLIVTSDYLPAHVQCDHTRKRLHDACGSARSQEVAGVKAAVDVVMLGISDWAMQYSSSTLFETAVSINPLIRSSADGLAGQCQRAPWSVVGCKEGLVHWTYRCKSER